MLGATFEQAEKDDLLGVVLVSGQQYTILSRVQLNSIHSKLLIKLEETIDLGGAVPTFQESGVRHSCFHLSCATQESFAWLKTTIDNIEIDGDGDEDKLCLQLVTPAEVSRFFLLKCTLRDLHLEYPSSLNWLKPRIRVYTPIDGFSAISSQPTGGS